MPNWVDIDIDVYGSDKDIKELKDFIGNGKLISQKLIPYPPSLEETIERFPYLPAEEKIKWVHFDKDLKDAAHTKWYNEVGYDWCCDTWGSKWGLSDLRLVEQDETSIKYNTQSPWSPPDGLFSALAKKFPTLDFVFTYFECGAGFHGMYHYQGGEEKEHKEAEYFGDRGG